MFNFNANVRGQVALVPTYFTYVQVLCNIVSESPEDTTKD